MLYFLVIKCGLLMAICLYFVGSFEHGIVVTYWNILYDSCQKIGNHLFGGWKDIKYTL